MIELISNIATLDTLHPKIKVLPIQPIIISEEVRYLLSRSYVQGFKKVMFTIYRGEIGPLVRWTFVNETCRKIVYNIKN